jgi:ribosome-binding protein aMBF1 (putative translation factor)
VAPEQEPASSGPESALALASKPRESRTKLKAVDLPQDTEFTGEVLRRVREQRGFSLAQLAERTRISTRHLENVEADQYDGLPATVYLRGILMNIARELGLDPLKVSRSYLALAAGAVTNKKR